MARKLRWLGLILLTLAVASMVSVYSYGRFAERMQGPPSHAFPPQPARTALDRHVVPMLHERGGRTGMSLIADNLDAFAIRAITARAAGRSLDLQYYIWHDDFTGQLLDRELLRAADRGVRVRLLLDDLNAHDKASFLAALDTHPNIEVRMFNPTRNRAGVLGRGVEMLLRGFSLNRRMHNKAWIADGRVAVMGGRNVGDEYFDAAPGTNFFDLDVALIGPAVQESEAIFDAFWNSSSAIPLTALVKPKDGALAKLRGETDKAHASRRAHPYLQRLRESPNVRELIAGNTPLHWVEEARVISDPPAKMAGEGQRAWLMHELFPAMAAAKQRLWIISPYFVPGERGVDWLQGIRARDVEVGILTNSLAATDVTAVHSGYAPYRAPLLKAGVALHELMPRVQKTDSSVFGSSGASLHTKAFLVDDDVGFIGSFNLDPRSLNLNTEMGILFRDRPATRELAQRYREKTSLQQSYTVMLVDDEVRWRDGSVTPERVWSTEPGVGLWRRGTVKMLEWLPIESQL